MKKHLLPLLLLFFAASFTSCIKNYEAPAPAVDPLTGSWYITAADENYGSGWSSFDPGFSGVFTFYNDGTAQYKDGYTYLQGSWYDNIIADAYYDANGNYYSGNHQSLEVQAGNTSGASISLYLDDISFSGNNEFIGTYYNGKSIERYFFERY